MKITNELKLNHFYENTENSRSSHAKKGVIPKLTKQYCADVPSFAYKANFMPSFGKLKKVKNIQLQEKATDKIVNASLYNDKIGDFYIYKLMVGRKEAGFMDMDIGSVLPKKYCSSPQTDNNIPEVKHLRSLLGDKYSGIGTELINVAVEESIKKGKNGALWLNAETGYASMFSDYRSDENPIPFYYKLGFKSLDKDIDDLIKKSLEANDYENLPEDATLILSSQDVYDFKKYYATHYNYSGDLI